MSRTTAGTAVVALIQNGVVLYPLPGNKVDPALGEVARQHCIGDFYAPPCYGLIAVCGIFLGKQKNADRMAVSAN